MQAHPYLTSPGLLRPSCSRFHAHLLPLGTAPPLGILPCIDPPNDPSKRPQQPSHRHHCVPFGCRRSTRSYRRSSTACCASLSWLQTTITFVTGCRISTRSCRPSSTACCASLSWRAPCPRRTLPRPRAPRRRCARCGLPPHVRLRHCDFDRGHKSLGFILKGRGGREQGRAGACALPKVLLWAAVWAWASGGKGLAACVACTDCHPPPCPSKHPSVPREIHCAPMLRRAAPRCAADRGRAAQHAQAGGAPADQEQEAEDRELRAQGARCRVSGAGHRLQLGCKPPSPLTAAHARTHEFASMRMHARMNAITFHALHAPPRPISGEAQPAGAAGLLRGCAGERVHA